MARKNLWQFFPNISILQLVESADVEFKNAEPTDMKD
jgi:hypothetical protein